MWVIVVEESGERTPQQWAVMADPACRTWATENGHHVRILDRDSKDEPEWIAEAAGKPLPFVFLVAPDGVARWSGSLPSTAGEMLKLLKQHGAEK